MYKPFCLDLTNDIDHGLITGIEFLSVILSETNLF